MEFSRAHARARSKDCANFSGQTPAYASLGGGGFLSTKCIDDSRAVPYLRKCQRRTATKHGATNEERHDMTKKMKWAVVEVGGKNVLRLTTATRKSLLDVKADPRVRGARQQPGSGVCHKYFAMLTNGWSRFEFGHFANSLAEDSLRELNDALQMSVWRRSMFPGSDDDALDYLLDLGVPDSLIVQVL